MDSAYDFLEEIGKQYHSNLKRGPSLAELEAIMRLALRTNGEKYVSDLREDAQVEAVMVKTSKRPKRQKYATGDVFAIPMPSGRYLFGRIVNLSDGWDLIEVFAYVSKKPSYSSQITEHPRLLPPMWINPKELFADYTWKILHSDSEYDSTQLSSLRYAMGTPGNYKWVKVNDFQPRGPISDKEAQQLPAWAMLPRESVIEHIEEAAHAQGLKV